MIKSVALLNILNHARVLGNSLSKIDKVVKQSFDPFQTVIQTFSLFTFDLRDKLEKLLDEDMLLL